MSALEADFADVFAGQPDALGTRADELRTSANAIVQATEALNALVEGQASKAIDAVTTVAAKTKATLEKAETRYTGTASALHTFAVELAPIQATARTALQNADYYETRSYRTESDINDNQIAITRAEAEGLPTDDLWDEYRRLNNSLGSARQSVQDAQQTLQRARDDIRTAADRAISAIETATAEGADSFADDWNQFWGGVGDLFASIAQWAQEVFTSLASALIDIIATIVTALLVTLLLVVALVAAIALLAVLVLAPELLIPLLLAIAGVVVLIVASIIAVRVASDVGKETPTVKPYEPRHDAGSPEGVKDVFGEAAFVDNEGGADNTVVKIEKIVAADGSVSWRIVLPSTQDWQALASTMSGEDFELFKAMKDSGAVNDVDSNMALVLFPSLRTQYERAVIDAMQQAGIKGGPDGDPVMLVGFSQGGILAGHLAAYRSDSYNFAAIVVCGAPIDNMPIPDSTRVISVQHEGDPVPSLDFLTAPPDRDNWTTITDTAPGDPSDVSQIHNARQYGITLDDHLGEVKDVDDLDRFFDGPGSYTETEYYTWHE